MLAITPLLSVPGQSGGVNTLLNPVAPPDVAADVGPRYFVQAVNHATFGTSVTIYNKSDGSVAAGPIDLNSLGLAAGFAQGLGDPMVAYDHLADRWVLGQFAQAPAAGQPNKLFIFVSQTNDPTRNTWYSYQFDTQLFPDFPKLSVWPDGYYVSSNEVTVAGAYVLDRTNMLQGLPARPPQRFVAPALSGFGFQSLTPADLDGPAPPANSPAYFMRHFDDELHSPQAADPSRDFLEIWEFHTDFNFPGNSTFRLAARIPTSEFDSDFANAFNTVPQPGTAVRLDAVPEVIMHRLQYRNFGTYESLVGNFTVDVNGNDLTGIRWFELRKPAGGSWQLQQEGTLAPGDGVNRWMGSIAMNKDGAIMVGYSVANAVTSPGLRVSARVASDAPGTMGQGEVNLINGVGFHETNRWGDYFSMVVDPVDDQTFWFTGEYADNGNWGTQIFKLEVPAPPPPPPPPPAPSTAVQGIVYNDKDNNGQQDPGERGLPGFYVYYDLNNNGRPDLNEPSAITGPDGRYRLPPSGLTTVTVRQSPPPGWTQTSPPNFAPITVTIDPTGVTPASADFGNTGGNLFDFANAGTGIKQTTLAQNGPRHGILKGFHLGATVTAEADALSTDDNDGVTFVGPMFAGGTGKIDVVVSLGGQSRGLLQGWIDFNRDGDYDDPGEQIIKDLRLGEGTHSGITFPIPAGASTGPTHARFRYGWERGIGPTGPALAGEVEEYNVNIFGDNPQAINDTATVNQDSTLNSIPVLANDFPSTAGGLEVFSSQSPTLRGGTTSPSLDKQSVIYTPMPGFFGTDSFTYTIRDNSGKTATATVTVTVVPTFVAPQAVDDFEFVAVNTDPPSIPLDPSTGTPIRVLLNDILGANPPTRIASIVQTPANGAAVIDSNGTSDPSDDFIRYKPNSNFVGIDQFKYRIVDSVGAFSDATVTVVVGDAFTGDKVQYNVRFSDPTTGQPINQVEVGKNFVVTVTVADVWVDPVLRPNESETGVFAAYVDLLYPGSGFTPLVTLVGALDFSGDYTGSPEGSTSVPGIIDEAGAFRPFTPPDIPLDPPGRGEKVVFRATFRANATGSAVFQTDPADDVFNPGPPPVFGNHDTLVYQPTSANPITKNDISFLGGTIAIIPASGGGEGEPAHNYAMANDVTGDGRVTNNDFLTILTHLRNARNGQAEGEVGRAPRFLDTTNDRRVTPSDMFSVLRELMSRVRMGSGEGEATGSLGGDLTAPIVVDLNTPSPSGAVSALPPALQPLTTSAANNPPVPTNSDDNGAGGASSHPTTAPESGGGSSHDSALAVWSADDWLTHPTHSRADADYFEEILRGWGGK